MGMFDIIRCRYQLPLEGANALQHREFQTKDTPSQLLDLYEIREDGTLWHEAYDVEDRSEFGRWAAEHPGQPFPESYGLAQMGGCMTRVNKRWERLEHFTGEIRFHTLIEKDQSWIEWSTYFIDGKIRHAIPIGQAQSQSPSATTDNQ